MAIGPAPLSNALPVVGEGATWPKPWANWFTQAFNILNAATLSGTTADRPTTNLGIGRPYFDTDLGIPIWWDGVSWVDAAGNVV